MAHAIDTTTGKAAVMVVGEAAWHRLGVNVAEAQTSAEAISLARLNWKVTLEDMQTQWGPVPDKKAVIRDDTHACLGVVGTGYRAFQNHESFDFMDSLVGDKLAMYETAGAIHGGKRVWMMAKIPGECRVPGTDDVVAPYVLLTNSHDGTSSLRMIPTTVRVVCQNTLNLALSRAGSQGIAIRHCESLKARVEDARKNLGIIARRVEEFRDEVALLASIAISERQAQNYFRRVFKMARPKGGDGTGLLDTILGYQDQGAELVKGLLAGHAEQSERKLKADARLLDLLMDNLHNERNSLPGIEGSAWAAFNAASEYADHQMRANSDDTRLQSIWFGRADDVKQEAYQQALALAS